MIFPSIQIFFDKNFSIAQVYQFFEQMQKIGALKFCCLDLDSFCHLPQEICDFITSKNYQIVGIYMAENIFPAFEIHQPLFESDEFQTKFNDCLKNYYPHLTYFRVNETVDFYQLIEFNSQGKTGKTVNI